MPLSCVVDEIFARQTVTQESKLTLPAPKQGNPDAGYPWIPSFGKALKITGKSS
jgi:hypothetical protein